MRIHTDYLKYDDIIDILNTLHRIGRIPRHVVFKKVTEHGSRDYERAFEVQLQAMRKEDGDGRRQGNSGSYGAGDNYAATFDEWGWFLSSLYEKDEYARAGSKENALYHDKDDFHEKTGLSYHPEALRGNLTYPNEEQGEDPYPYVIGTGGIAGRKGAGRTNGEDLPTSYLLRAREKPGQKAFGYIRYAPRTLADVPN